MCTNHDCSVEALAAPGPRARAHAGFTLIELLVVIGLLSMLAVVLLPSIVGARKEGERAETAARIQYLQAAVEAFQLLKSRGYYPPDNFKSPGDPDVKAQGSAEETNAGIESALIYLHQRAEGYPVFDDKEDWLRNTDGDSNSVEIPLLKRRGKVEVVDAWGVPLAYFTAQSFGRAQKIKTETGDVLDVTAWKNPNSSGYLGRGYQIISAGPDMKFNTEDDITYPQR